MAEVDVANLTHRLFRELRHEIREIASSQRELFDYVRNLSGRMEAKFSDLDRSIAQARDEIELTVKMEVGGRMAGFESRQETKLDEALARIEGTLGTVTADDKLD